MKNLVSAFDKTTELLVFEVEIPKEKLGAVRELMAWTEPEDEIYCYDVSKAQLQQLEFITGTAFDPEKFDFQLTSHK